MNRRLLRFALFGLPVLLWMAVILIGSSTVGTYTRSWLLIQSAFHHLSPEVPAAPKQPNGIELIISMYTVNSALRRVMHPFLYAVLSSLLVRAIQGGQPRLKPASMIGAFILSVLYVGVDEIYRYITPERDAKWVDLTLNLIGVAVVLVGTVVWFAIKALERRLLAPEGRAESPPLSG